MTNSPQDLDFPRPLFPKGGYKYPNWFQTVSHFFATHLAEFKDQPNLEFLQIGTFTGDASVWLKENILTHPTSRLTDVDTWGGSGEHGVTTINWDWSDVEKTYDDKVKHLKPPFEKAGAENPGPHNIIKFKGTSREFYALWKKTKEERACGSPDFGAALFPKGWCYDFIYIDGDHTANVVYEDACAAWNMLKPNGILAFDDYLWTPPQVDRNNVLWDSTDCPRTAIDKFVKDYPAHKRITSIGEWQFWMRK